MEKYWSTLTKSLNPYVPGEQPQDQQYLKLNTNENPYPPSSKVTTKIKLSVDDRLRLYPDPNADKLKEAIAEYYNITENNVFVGNGSDEVLAFSFLAFFKGKAAISFPNITYSFYPVYCSIFEIEHEKFSLDKDFSIDVTNISTASGGIIFPNPNAPTGICLTVPDIEIVLQRFQNIVVIVDEAYIDFGGESCVRLIDQYPNLLVIQTLSKSRSLAGLRVGFSIGHPDLIQALERVKNSFNSYPLDCLAIEGAVAAIEDKDYFNDCCQKIIDTREWLTNELDALSFHVLPSKANFLFVRHSKLEAVATYRALKEKKILVRHFSDPSINNFLRITIGEKQDMVLFLAAIKSIVGA